MRKGSRSIGLSPSTAQPLDDDLLRPWRQWWGLSISRDLWIRRAGERNMFVRRCRYARWGRMFYYDQPFPFRRAIGNRWTPNSSKQGVL